jgi:hypothetical protein
MTDRSHTGIEDQPDFFFELLNFKRRFDSGLKLWASKVQISNAQSPRPSF